MTFKLPPLPYDYEDLEPHMSARTLHLHHGKHHQAYIDGVNDILEEAELENLSLEDVILKSAKNEDAKSLFDKAAQCWNHEFFWNCLSPQGGGQPDGALARQIEADFGSFERFCDAFKNAATGQFGSGWAWLVLAGGRLEVTSTANADLPFIYGQQPLLTCDVWEHAYYLDYQNERERYVDVFLENLVNWQFVAQQFAVQGEGSTAAARRYRAAQEDFARSGKVPDAAAAAADALEGAESEDLEAARRASAKAKTAAG